MTTVPLAPENMGALRKKVAGLNNNARAAAKITVFGPRQG
jgi:hypothetical protein